MLGDQDYTKDYKNQRQCHYYSTGYWGFLMLQSLLKLLVTLLDVRDGRVQVGVDSIQQSALDQYQPA